MTTKQTAYRDLCGQRIYEGDIIQCNGNPEDLWAVRYGTYELCDEEGDYIGDMTGWYMECEPSNPIFPCVPEGLDFPLLASRIVECQMRIVKPAVLR